MSGKQTAIRLLLMLFLAITVGNWLHLIAESIPYAIAIFKLQFAFAQANWHFFCASLFTLGCAVALFAKVE